MQQLKFEPSWDKAVAAQDREHIELIFLKTKDQATESILFSPIREALNHKKEFLVTVLVHNFSNQELIFNKIPLVYLIDQELAAEHVFTIPIFNIPAKTSMPWTFIFPVHNMDERTLSSRGYIRIDN